MIEQILLMIALIGCLGLVWRQLLPARQSGCQAGECGCETDAPSPPCSTEQLQIKPSVGN